MDVNVVSIGSVIPDILEDSGLATGIDKNVYRKWINDYVKSILSTFQLVEHIDLLDVKNYKVLLPENFNFIIQAAFSGNTASNIVEKVHVKSWVANALNDCKIHVEIECPKCHSQECKCDSTNMIRINASELAKRSYDYLNYIPQPHFLSHGDFHGHGTPSFYHKEFMLMRRTTNSFHSPKYHIKGCVNLKTSSSTEYDVQMPNLVLNVPKGKVLLSYLGYPVDGDGLILVPDVVEVFDGIKMHVEQKIAFKMYTKERKREDRMLWIDLQQMDDRKKNIARATLQQIPFDKWKALFQNMWGKYIPNYQAENDLYGYTPDRFDQWH